MLIRSLALAVTIDKITEDAQTTVFIGFQIGVIDAEKHKICPFRCM